jgi:hypothetical protein
MRRTREPLKGRAAVFKDLAVLGGQRFRLVQKEHHPGHTLPAGSLSPAQSELCPCAGAEFLILRDQLPGPQVKAHESRGIRALSRSQGRSHQQNAVSRPFTYLFSA